MPDDHVSLLRKAGLLDVPEFPTTRTPPEDLCGEHRRMWRAWWDYAKSYDPRKPKDFGNVGPISDARTSHPERRADWLRKGLTQLRVIETMCRNGNSPQCGQSAGDPPMKHGEAAALAESAQADILSQSDWYMRRLPSVCTPYFLWHSEAALDVPDAEQKLRPLDKFACIRRLQALSRDKAVNIIFTGQDIGTLSLWQEHRVVYTVDDELWAALGDTEDDYEVPAGLFQHLPHPDPFIAFPEPLWLPLDDYADTITINSPPVEERRGLRQKVTGFFLTGRVERDLRAYEDDLDSPYGVGLVQRSTMKVTDSLALLLIGDVYEPDGRRHMVPDGFGPDTVYTRVTIRDGRTVGDMIRESQEHFLSADESTAWWTHMPMMLRRAMSLVIYLCSTNADLRAVPGPPVKRQGGKTKHPADAAVRPKVVEVGYRIGTELRAYRARSADSTSLGQSGRQVRPHIRRAHFHTFRFGKGREQFRVDWLPPIPVRFEGPADRPTVSKVKAGADGRHRAKVGEVAGRGDA